ncbi:MAG TPA: DAK2 domain-containing protein, partial [Chloroflexota bacterium]|nr:DAK2 domain-containing protein [Chloroflexota bacterium]
MKGSTRPRAKAPEAGRQLLAMAQAAERRLASEVAVINALNVFPVPDGDTGTNMLATIREALAQAAGPLEPALIPEQLALGAMRGARGNSGVILSQLFRAQHEVLRQRQAEGELTA